MKLYTKTGDKGQTGLANGMRVKKTDLRVAAYGDVDELNSFIGLARCHCDDKLENALLEDIQRDLFLLEAHLSQAKDVEPLRDVHIEKLEKAIDSTWEKTKPLTYFILPAGTEYAALMHVCRTVCRRAERSVIALGEKEKVDDNLVIYLNRLSDLFFALARKANQDAGIDDTIWKREQR